MPDDGGINKPFDRILKAFADEAPGLFLHLLGLAPGTKGDIQPLRPETAPPVVLPDYVALVRSAAGGDVIFHAEFESRYDALIPRNMARYGASLAWQYRLPVESVLVLLRPEGVPAGIPEVGHYDIGRTHTTHPYRVVRLWELDPSPVLETGNVRLLPWAVLMRSDDAQVRHIAALVSSEGDDEAAARFLILGSIRYDRSALNELLGGRRMSGFIKAYMDGSKLVEELREEARAEARAAARVEALAEGRAEGQAAEARNILRLGLRARFPDLESLPEIDRISSAPQLEALIDQVFRSADQASIQQAILTAGANPN